MPLSWLLVAAGNAQGPVDFLPFPLCLSSLLSFLLERPQSGM